MKNKPLALGVFSLASIIATIGVGWLAFASSPVMNEMLILTALCFAAALIAAIWGTISAVAELVRGTPRKAPAIAGLILNAVLSLVLSTVGGMTLYFIFFVDPNNFRL
ncbi:MAG: hypothetical protein JSS81_17650 [Acidobacteria bacterium]|nr:hypothetical protein [Acidobacteriota bacterium]